MWATDLGFLYLFTGIFQEPTPVAIASNAIKMTVSRDFPGGPMAKTRAPNAGDRVSIPNQGTRSHMHN